MEIIVLQEQLAGKSAELSQLCAKYGELNEKLNCVESQHAAGATVSVDLKLVGGACVRHESRGKMTRRCKESSTTPPKTAFLALLTK